jgi:hypothetical protein
VAAHIYVERERERERVVKIRSNAAFGDCIVYCSHIQILDFYTFSRDIYIYIVWIKPRSP